MAKEQVKKALKKGKATFNLVGKVKLTDKTFSLNNEYSGSEWTDNQMYLAVDCGNGNTIYAEMKGGMFPDRDNILYGYDKDEKGDDGRSKQVQIAWEDRFGESILDTISDSSFLTVGVEKDVKEKTLYKKFLSAYDAVEYLQEHLSDGMIVNVKGDLKYSTYNDNVSVNKEIKSIVLSRAEDDNDFKAAFTQTILLDSSSIGKKDKEKNSVYINAYVIDYVGKPKIDGEKVEIKKNVTFPKTFELEINEDNPEMTNKMLSKFFKVTKKDDMIELTVDGNLVEGQAIVNITEDDIPDDIKELIEMGIYSEEEAKNKCAVGNKNKEKRMVIKRPAITYVGDGEERKPTIALDKQKYKFSDMYFYNQALEDAGVETEDDNVADVESVDDDADLLALLDM